MDYYQRKQQEHEAMAPYLAWMFVIGAMIFVVWIVSELIKHYVKG